MSSNKKNEKGLTLLELLVTISIVTFISTLGVVQLKQNRDEAKNVNCNVNIEQYLKAFELVYDSTGEYPDPGGVFPYYCLGDYDDDKCGMNGTHTSESPTLNNILQNYISLNIFCSEACSYEGAEYRCLNRINELCTGFIVRWALKGSDQSCGVGYSIGSIGGDCNYCEYTKSL